MNKKTKKRQYNYRGLRLKQIGIVLLILLSVSLLYFLREELGMTGFVIVETTQESGFDLGKYNLTFYNETGNYLQLNLTLSSGNYTSQIFDLGGGLTVFSNLSWVEDVPYGDELPNRQRRETVLGGMNMSSNILLLHLDTNSLYGENRSMAYDFSGNNNNMTMYGTNFTSDAKFNNSINFTGFSHGIIPYSSVFNGMSGLAISVWYKPRGCQNNDEIVMKGSSYYLRQGCGGAGNSLKFIVNTATSNSEDVHSNRSEPILNDWNHLVLNYDGAKAILYINGFEAASTANATGTVTVLSEQIDIGDETGGTEPIDALLDELAMWNKSLTDTEMFNLYKRGALRLNLSTRNCDDDACSGESWGNAIYETANSTPLGINSNRYFQYRAYFQTGNASYSPLLYNVTINNGDCIVPINDMNITRDTTLCSGTYYINDTDGDYNVLTIGNNSVFVTCNKTMLVGNRSGYGFNVPNMTYATIKGCNMYNFSTAIEAVTSHFITIRDNNITNMTKGTQDNGSIHLFRVNNSFIFNNTIMYNNGTGIYLEGGRNNTIIKNLMMFNGLDNIWIRLVEMNTSIINNTMINSSGNGITIESGAWNITITNNTISDNHWDEIRFYLGVNKSLIYNNYIDNIDDYGYSSEQYGITLNYSYDNVIYNNIFNSSHGSIRDTNGRNYFNTSNYSGTNIIGGANIGGNYYSDYGHYDENNDGFGEIVYSSSISNGYDALPLSGNNCLTPINGIQIQKSATLCSGSFAVSEPDTDKGFMNITNSSVALQCNNTRLISNYDGIAINTNPGSGQLTNITIKNCYFESTNLAIQMKNTSHSYVYDNVFNMSISGTNTVMYLYNVNNSIIANNTFWNLSNDAIRINDASNSIFDNNTFWKINSQAIVFFNILPSSNVTFKDNLINNTKNVGITSDVSTDSIIHINNSKFYNNTLIDIGSAGDKCILMSGFNNEFIGNRLINCTVGGIRSGVRNGFASPADNYYIKSNMINISHPTGIDVGAIDLSGSNITIVNNTISYLSHDRIGAAITTQVTINNSYIINNTIIDSSYGLALPNASDFYTTGSLSSNLTISGNKFINVNISGIMIGGNNITIVNNTISSFKGLTPAKPGIYGISLNNSIIANNIIYGFKDSISIMSSENLTIINNTIYNNTLYGINITKSRNVSITSNVLYNNSNFGIYLFKSINNTVKYNNLYNNTIAGIKLESSNYTIIENNNLTFNGGRDTPTVTFYASAAPYKNDALGAVYNFTESGAGSQFNYQDGSSIDVINNKTDVSLLVNGTANMHLALVKINSSAAGYGHRNLTLFIDDSIATSCLGTAQYLSDIALAAVTDETNCTYFQANIFTANGNQNYTYNGLTNATISLVDGYLSPPHLSAVIESETPANIIITESSDNNITNNTIEYSEYYAVRFNSSSNNTLTNNTIRKNALYGINAWGDSGSANKIINSTNITTKITSSIIRVYWFLKVYTHDGGNVFSNVNVSFSNKSGSLVASAVSGTSGYTDQIMLIEYEDNGSSNQGNKIMHTNYTISATRPTTLDPESISYNLSSSGSADLNMPTTPPGGGGGGGGTNNGCSDQCSQGQTTCSSSTSYQTCGNYDDDNCLEYGNNIECENGLVCSKGNCIKECNPEWECTQWSICENNIKRRTCSDKNNCNTNKPAEEMPCEIEIREEMPYSKEHNATKCFEAKGLSEDEIMLYEDMLNMMPCQDEGNGIIESIKTRFRCKGIEIDINDASLNIVYKDDPNFYLNLRSSNEYKEYCPWCFNEKQDYDETGIDCGGSCKDCGSDEEIRLEVPFKKAKPDYRLLIFAGSSFIAAFAWYMVFFRRVK